MKLYKYRTAMLSVSAVLVGLFSIVSTVLADIKSESKPSLWLQQISESTARQSYQGTFIYRCDAQLVAMRIVHAANEGSGYEKLVSLNGPPHEVIQDGQSITSSLFRGKRAMEVGVNKGDIGSFDKVLDAHYMIVEIGEDRIANRHTKVMEIRPKDKYRYGFLIWVDSITGIVLRSDMADETGQIIEQVMFIDVEMLADNIAEKRVGIGGDVNSATEEGEAASLLNEQPTAVLKNDSQWHVSKMPSGFRLSERYLRGDGSKEPKQEQLVFSDGLASVSVFIEPYQTNDQPMLGQARIGAVNVYGKLIANYQITVVGDVPKATVEYIAGSIFLQ